MENLLLAFRVVLPLFLMMALGYGTRRIGLVDEVTLKKMNNYVFRVFLPILAATKTHSLSFVRANANAEASRYTNRKSPC